MITDFALRGVLLQDFDRRAAEPCDLVFRKGRLTRFQPGPACAGVRAYLTPGFCDAHHHLLHMGLTAGRCDLGACTSLAEALEQLAAWVARQPDDTRVLWGERWDESLWPERRGPSTAELDAVVADRPMALRRICGHRAVLNSLAAREAAAKLGALGRGDEPDEIQSLALATVWPPTPAELERALLVAQERAVALGVTRVTEMGGYGAIDAYRALEVGGGLRIRLDLFVPPAEIERALGLRAEGLFDGPRLRLGGVKLFADGSIGARSAAVRQPYADHGGCGELLMKDEELRGWILRCASADLPVAVHAIGDVAIEQVVTQVEQAATEAGRSLAGHVRIEHAEMISARQVERAAAAGIDLSLQPNFVANWAGPGGLYETALGAERLAAMNPFRAIHDAPVGLVFGSDGMPMSPALGLAGAVQRHPLPEQRLTPEEALAIYLGARAVPAGLYTRSAWWDLGCDGLVVYDRDPLLLTAGDPAGAPVLGVLWGGEWLLEPPAELYRSGVIHGF